MVKELDNARKALLATGDPRDRGFAEIITGMINARTGDIEEALSEDPPVLERKNRLEIDCNPTQVASIIKQIGPDTRVYIGHLEPGIFNLLARHNITEVYTSFPEGKIKFSEVTVGGKTEKDLERELKQRVLMYLLTLPV